MMKKQVTLFPQDAIRIIAELDLREAERTAAIVNAAVEAHCDLIEVAGSIRRQKPRVHNIDFVVVAKSDADWQRINEKIKQLKAKPNCSGNSVIKAFALAIPHEDAIKIRDNVGFFQAVRSAIIKTTESRSQTEIEDMDLAIKQIISKAVISDRVIDIFAAAGLNKPNISILSDEFLNFAKTMPQKNLAFEALKKLLTDEIRIRQRKNLIQARSFEELLDKAIKAYTNRSIEAAEIIQQLIDLAKKMRDEQQRGIKLNLTEEEIAFYDALADNESAKQVLGDETLHKMARELVETVRKNVRTDWTLRENVQARLRVLVKRLLKKYGYPPDKQQIATDTVLDQAKLLCKDWAEVTG